MSAKEAWGNKRFRALIAVSLLVVAGIAAGAAASKPPCTRQVVEGPVESSGDFRAVSVVLYQSGMFPGDPLIVRVEGNISASNWYSVTLPGVRLLDQVRVQSQFARINTYYLEEGALKFYGEMKGGAPTAKVIIYYIPGSASWTHQYELDLDADQLALVAHVDWRASVIFRDIDFLLVSGELHSASSYPGSATSMPPPAASGAMGFGGAFGLASTATAPERDDLRAFTIPVSSDAGIYVVHRSERVDIPGSAGKSVHSCGSFSFYVRVYESPLSKSELVVARSGSVGPVHGLPLYIELTNTGNLPWIPGRAELWRDQILVGSDSLEYTQRGGEARVEMGTAFDITVDRTTFTRDNETFVNFSVKNTDTVDYTLEIREALEGRNITSFGAFTLEGDELVATLPLAPGEEAFLGFRAQA